MNSIPRPEYPRPQLARREWINLNGEWSCEFDQSLTGKERGFAGSAGFSQAIIVPFCPESVLSSVGRTDFILSIWYHRVLVIPPVWNGNRIILHFGAVDYFCEVFIDNVAVGSHYGGSSPFSFDVTAAVTPGVRHNLVVCVRDDTRNGHQPCGKQSDRYHSYGCKYTRVTGIWRTVWCEPVPVGGLESVDIMADYDSRTMQFLPRLYSGGAGRRLRVRVNDSGGQCRADNTVTFSPGVSCTATPDIVRSWSPEDPHLYSILFEVIDRDGPVIDSAESYAGLRSVTVEGNRLCLNGEPRYLRMVLDQGYYPDGIWTAPTDDALRRDIELALESGFNGARLHQKVFDPRYHYWADRLGFMTWAEFPSWGIDCGSIAGARNFLAEWREIVTHYRNHPSIIAWTPFNESNVDTDREAHDRLQTDVYGLTKALDPTRPVNGCSGWFQVKTDLYTAHIYEQDADVMAGMFDNAQSPVVINFPDRQALYGGQPYFIDEMGGTRWVGESEQNKNSESSWGYGKGPESHGEFYERIRGLVGVILEQEICCGYCYTQLTDVEQEQNGIYTYDRGKKHDSGILKEIFSKCPREKT